MKLSSNSVGPEDREPLIWHMFCKAIHRFLNFDLKGSKVKEFAIISALSILMASLSAHAQGPKAYPDLCDKQAIEIVKGIQKAVSDWNTGDLKSEYVGSSTIGTSTVQYNFVVTSSKSIQKFEVAIASYGGTNFCDIFISVK